MTAGLLLAYITVFWPVLVMIWKLVDPTISETTYTDPFYKVYLAGALVAQVTLGILVLVGTLTAVPLAWMIVGYLVVSFLWEIADSPSKVKFNNKFYLLVATVSSITAIVCALVVLL